MSNLHIHQIIIQYYVGIYNYKYNIFNSYQSSNI